MTATARAEKPKQKRSAARELLEWALLLGGALLVAMVVKAFLIQAFYIPSPSMVPTLQVRDRVLVNKLSYRLHDVNRGDIVVFERPEGAQSPEIKDLIKRVVAVGGDTIESRGDTVYVNDRPLHEPYVRSETLGRGIPRSTVPAGEVFVMGDNRSNSTDSRYFGTVDEDTIVGRAFIRVWPLTSVGLL